MKPPVVAIVVPTFGCFDYAQLTISSWFHASDMGRAYVPVVVCVDDGSSPDELHKFQADVPGYEAAAVMCGGAFISKLLHRNTGLTNAWNVGIRLAMGYAGVDIIAAGNSDLLFPTGWSIGIISALKTYALVGPVTNAPGTEAKQFVGLYSRGYSRSDSLPVLEQVQQELLKTQANSVEVSTINGFFMAASAATWRANMFDDTHYFRPRNDFDSKGRPNPTPLLTLNEYELQRRWHASGLQSAIAHSSYVFHYRSVTRGSRHVRGDWLRRKSNQVH